MIDGHRPTEFHAMRRVVVKRPREAFRDRETIEGQWRALGYGAAPDLVRAEGEHERFCELLGELGAEVVFLPVGEGLGLDSLYARDAAVVGPDGAILARMGKGAREAEPAALGRCFAEIGFPVVGAVADPGTLEGGDVAWLDDSTVLVGRGYRTNDAGIDQLAALLGEEVELIRVPLPHWRGPGDVFHMMSVISPLDEDLLLVYSPLLPVPLRELLLERGFGLVEVPDEELDSLGCNVLAVAPRLVLAVEGNKITRQRMEAAGVEVHTFEGNEICLLGAGGPTCLTRPLERG